MLACYRSCWVKTTGRSLTHHGVVNVGRSAGAGVPQDLWGDGWQRHQGRELRASSARLDR